MKNKPGSMIVSTGRAVPDKILTNQDFEKMVDTSDEWITERTGMKVRHIAEEGIVTSDLGAAACRRALAKANVPPESIDVIIVGTITPDMPFPSTACFIQDKIGAKNAAAFDISAACSGFIYGLIIADGLIRTGAYKNVLVVGVEILSRMVDYSDRNTCVLFGDGAGAALLQPSDGKRGLMSVFWQCDGGLSNLLYAPAGGSKHPASHQTVDEKLHFIRMAGREVFKSAVKAMSNAANQAIENAGITSDEIDLLIPHQANNRIIQATAQMAKIPPEKVFSNIENYGNTSAASIPIALDEAIETGRLQVGQRCLLVAFGGGFTWGSTVVQF